MASLAALVEHTRRLAAQQTGAWHAVGCEVFSAEGRVAVASDAWRAQYLAGIHNVFLPLANAWVSVRKSLTDRAMLARLLASESGRPGE